jgi:hypothetical protein
VELGHFEHGLEQQGVDVYQGGCSQGPRHSAGLVFTELPRREILRSPLSPSFIVRANWGRIAPTVPARRIEVDTTSCGAG